MPRGKNWRRALARKAVIRKNDGENGRLVNSDGGGARPISPLFDKGPSECIDNELEFLIDIEIDNEPEIQIDNETCTEPEILIDNETCTEPEILIDNETCSEPEIFSLNRVENVDQILLDPVIMTVENVSSVNKNETLYYAYAVKSMNESSRSVIFGSYHQGDVRFSVDSRGSQCTINALCALIYAQYSNFSSRELLDDVLNTGDQIYKSVLNTLKRLEKFRHRLLSLDEIPDKVNVLSRLVCVEKADIISGVAVEQFGSSALPSLHQSLHTAFQNVQHVLVMIGAICSAVFVKDDLFWLFDSHSHGKDGLSSPDGKCMLMSFICLDDLVTFMYAMYSSMKIDLSCQYEILPLRLAVSGGESSNASDLLAKYFEDQEIRRDHKMSKQKSSLMQNSGEQEDWIVVRHKKKDRKEYFKKFKQAKRTKSRV